MNKLICWHARWFQIANEQGGCVKVCKDCGANTDERGVWPVVDVLSEWSETIEEKE